MNIRPATVSFGLIAAAVFVFSCLFASEASEPSVRVTITVTQADGGSISPDGGDDNQIRFEKGGKAVFTVKPDKGYHVVDILTSAGSVLSQAKKKGKIYKYTIAHVLDEDTITATFEKDSYAFTVSITGNGTIAGSGLTCDDSTCSGTYSYGDQIAMTATAGESSSLKSWSGCKPDKTVKTLCTVTITKDQTAKAAFKTVSGTVSVKMKADFSSSSASAPFRAAPGEEKLTSCPGGEVFTAERTDYAAGLDCDQDGGVIQYLTPVNYKIALRRLSLVRDNGDKVDFIQDPGMLSQSPVYNLKSQVVISQKIPAGTYSAIQAEIYYYEIKMPINNPQDMQRIRVYLSDDDFPAEGSLGHHQGDITLIDNNGDELGWVGMGTSWLTSTLQTDKSSVARPGSTDTETGHQRGLFGDITLWDQDAFVQGSDRDIYLLTSPVSLVVSESAREIVSFDFNVKDTWFWEDFDGDGHFNPCENDTKDACAANAEWAPLFNLPVLSVK